MYKTRTFQVARQKLETSKLRKTKKAKMQVSSGKGQHVKQNVNLTYY